VLEPRRGQGAENENPINSRLATTSVSGAPFKACLWWSGKQLQTSVPLSNYIGKNEKTSVVVRLQSITAGPPVREPRIDEDTHKVD
jgi:cilia- and flagella-associated protein 298